MENKQKQQHLLFLRSNKNNVWWRDQIQASLLVMAPIATSLSSGCFMTASSSALVRALARFFFKIVENFQIWLIQIKPWAASVWSAAAVALDSIQIHSGPSHHCPWCCSSIYIIRCQLDFYLPRKCGQHSWHGSSCRWAPMLEPNPPNKEFHQFLGPL